MFKVLFAGVTLVAAGIVIINFGVEVGGLLLIAGALALGYVTIGGLSTAGKKIERHLPD